MKKGSFNAKWQCTDKIVLEGAFQTIIWTKNLSISTRIKPVPVCNGNTGSNMQRLYLHGRMTVKIIFFKYKSIHVPFKMVKNGTSVFLTKNTKYGYQSLH